MASDFDFDLPLNQYFLAEIAEHLESKGINCLDDLIDAMYEDPERWATRLDLNKERSNGILSWLYSKKLNGAPIDFPPVLETELGTSPSPITVKRSKTSAPRFGPKSIKSKKPGAVSVSRLKTTKYVRLNF